MAANGVELATAYVSLTVDGSKVDAGVRRSLSGVDAQADAVGKSSGKKMGAGISAGILSAAGRLAGPLAAVFAGIKIGQILGDSITAGSDLQQAAGAVDAVFKKQGVIIEKSAVGAADALGLSREQYMRFATVLGAGLKNQGLKDFTKRSQELVSIGADLSAQFGGSTQDAVAALGAVMRGEYDSIERYGISLSESAVKAELARLGLDKLEGPALTAAKAQARLSIITNQSKDALGAFGRESDTYAGKQARLTATLENIKARVGTALLPALTGLSDWFLKKGLPAIEKFGTGIGGVFSILANGDFTGASKTFGWAEDSGQVDFLFNVRDAFIKIKDAVVTAVKWVRDDLWPALKDGWETIRPGLMEARDTIMAAFGGDSAGTVKGFADFFTDYLIPVISLFVNDFLPIMARQLAATIEVVKLVWGAFITLRDVVIKVTSVILGAFSKMLNAGADMLEAISVVPGFGWAKDAADKLRGVAKKAEDVKDAIDKIPTSKTFTMHFTSTGQLRLPNGVSVDMGTWKARAHGGPVRKGQPYVVGENRPELFVPDSNGRILPRVPSADSAPAAMGGFDYYRMTDVVEAGMRRVSLAVDTRENALAVARHNNARTQL